MRLLHLRTGKLKYIIFSFLGLDILYIFSLQGDLILTFLQRKRRLNAQSAETLSRAVLEMSGGFLVCSVQAIVIFSVQRAVVAR